MSTLGIRNNNPFNIVRTGDHWQGQVKSCSRFVRFRNIDYGIRAGYKLLHTYIMRGYDTPEKIIYRYAPPSENPTEKYIEFVCSDDMERDTQIRFSDDSFYKLLKRMALFESKYDLTYVKYLYIRKTFGLS